MTPKKEVKREHALERRYSNPEPEIWRVYIEGTMFGKPRDVRKQILKAVEKTAEALPGVQKLRVTAKQRNHTHSSKESK